MRLTADADTGLWVPITGRGGRHQRAAIRLLQKQNGLAWAQSAGAGGRMMSWAMRRLMPRALQAMSGRMLVWSFKAAPDAVVASANVQELTPQLRTARAMMPMEYDDTETFRGALGAGERLVLPHPPEPNALPLAAYTWDTGTMLVTVTALCTDAAMLGELLPAIDDLARSIRLEEPGASAPDTITLPPA